MKIKDIGERGLLQILQGFCPGYLVGDDAAILPIELGKSLVVTTDMLVDGVHFSDRTTSASDVGWRAAAANLSDLAAMGASPLGVAIALGIQADTSVSWVEQLYQGVTECLQPYHTPIVGGDIVRSPITTISIAAFGEIDPTASILRSNCQPENVIVVTGVHGASRAGLELLLNSELGQLLTETEKASLILAHQRPQARLDILPILRSLLECQPEVSIGGMDSSDGLADAIVQICQASGVGAKIEWNQIPIPPALTKLVTNKEALEWALYGGEDFELVFCLPRDIGEKLVAKIGEGAAIVGTTTSDTDILLLNSQEGIHFEEKLSEKLGFKHFGT